MSSALATTILILAVVTTMQLACDVVAFVHGWQDGLDSHDRDRHGYVPRLFYTAGWRLRRARLTADRRAFEVERQARERLYQALDATVAADIARLQAEVEHDLDQLLRDEP